MNAPGAFPQSYTTTTAAPPPARIRMDLMYVRTIPGMLKIAQALLCFIAFICSISGLRYHGLGASVGWAQFVSIVGFILSTALLVAYLMHVIEVLNRVPWLLVELGYDVVWAFFLLIASSVMASYSGNYGIAAHGAYAFFGFMALIAFAVDAFLKFKAWRNREAPQGLPPMPPVSGGMQAPTY